MKSRNSPPTRNRALAGVVVASLLVTGASSMSRESDDPAIPERVPAKFPASWRFPAGARATFGQHAMVASDSRIASEVGAQIMREGGNAVDAAVATGFALAVAYP